MRSEVVTVSVIVPVLPADRVTLEGLRDAVGLERERPAGLTLAVRPTLPEKSLMLPSVIVDCPEELIGTVSDVGLAETAKSTMLTARPADWVRLLPVPVTVTVWSPVFEEEAPTVRVALAVPPAARATVDGLIVTVGAGPLEFKSESAVVTSDTVPVKESILVTVIDEEPDWPGSSDSELGFAARLKLGETVEILQAVRG